MWKRALCITVLFAAAAGVIAARQTGTTATAATKPHVDGPYNEKADAHKDIAAALALAQRDKKNVLLDFGGNWCLDCVVLEKLFDDHLVRPFLEANFHVVHIDIGQWDKNKDIDQQYGGVIAKGVPAVVVLDPSGKMIDSTKDGSLESARHATAEQILARLNTWAPKRPSK
jgi:thiol:disulfide interchange protein